MDFSVLQGNITYMLWGTFPQGPLAGAALTVAMGVAAAILALILGVAGGAVQALVRSWVGKVLDIVFAFLRSIPVLMLFFWTFFMLPIMLGVHVPGVVTVIIALALIYAAYVAQIVGAGLHALAHGQWDAGLSLGLTRWQTLRYIGLPQALRMMIPSLVNQGIALLKDTSLASILSVAELTMIAGQVSGQLYIYPVEVFLFGALIYLVLCGSLELLGAYLQKRLKSGAH